MTPGVWVLCGGDQDRVLLLLLLFYISLFRAGSMGFCSRSRSCLTFPPYLVFFLSCSVANPIPKIMRGKWAQGSIALVFFHCNHVSYKLTHSVYPPITAQLDNSNLHHLIAMFKHQLPSTPYRLIDRPLVALPYNAPTPVLPPFIPEFLTFQICLQVAPCPP